MSNQLEKVYAMYTSMVDFPLGALLIYLYLFYFCSTSLTGEPCQTCKKYLDMSPDYGLLLPLFKDMYLRPYSQEITRHYICMTC
jgi:hypothetical protein